MRMTQKQRDKPDMADSLVRERHSELRGGVKNKQETGKPIKNAKTFQIKCSEYETDSEKNLKLDYPLGMYSNVSPLIYTTSQKHGVFYLLPHYLYEF